MALDTDAALDVMDVMPDPAPAALTPEQVKFFHDEGYLIWPRFFDLDQVARFKAHIDRLWAARKSSQFVIDAYEDYASDRQLERQLFAEVDEQARAFPYKLNDTHLTDPVVREFSLDARLLDGLKQLLGSTAVVCNTLLFERGSEQPAHFDTFYMPSPTRNKMAATWIAFDAVTDGNGPLVYYPKSHLIEPYYFTHGKTNAISSEMPGVMRHIDRIVAEYGLEQKKFYPQPGDLLIWHAQLLHGGAPILDMAETRTSLVTHYWTKLDYPDPAQHIALDQERLILVKPHLNVVGKQVRAEVDAFLKGLNTPSEHRAVAPETFDPRGYLLHNLDVFRAGVDPYTHYAVHGRHEGRAW